MGLGRPSGRQRTTGNGYLHLKGKEGQSERPPIPLSPLHRDFLRASSGPDRTAGSDRTAGHGAGRTGGARIPGSGH